MQQVVLQVKQITRKLEFITIRDICYSILAIYINSGLIIRLTFISNSTACAFKLLPHDIVSRACLKHEIISGTTGDKQFYIPTSESHIFEYYF